VAEQRVKPENFMKGAMLITVGALVSRLLGAIYWPVSQTIMGDAGLALTTPPSAAYQIILAISSVGLNVAISRLIADRLAVEDYSGAKRVMKVATNLLVVSGLAFSILFALGARWMANVQNFPEAWPGFLVLAPAILMVTLESAYRGLFQGMQQMKSSAISQVVEQGGRVVLGLTLAVLLTPIAVNYGAAGINAGNTLGVVIGLAYMLWIYLRDRPMTNWNTSAIGMESYAHKSTWNLMGKILAIAMPLSMVGAVLPLMQQIDSSIVTTRLIGIGIAKGQAQQALAWLMNAGTLRDVPSILTLALYASLVPAVTQSMATGKREEARSRAVKAFRLAFLAGVPATIGLIVGARDAYGFLYKGDGYVVMAALGASTIFVMVQQISTGVLQGMGLIWISARNILIGVLVKTVLTYWWVGIPSIGVNGASHATTVAFLIAAGLNMGSLRRELGLTINFKSDILRPLIAGLVMGAALWAVSPLVHRVIHSNRLAGLLTIGLGGLVYLVAILVVRGVTESDLAMLPGMRRSWIDALQRRNLLGE
jgi:stage V sporulation protein B